MDTNKMREQFEAAAKSQGLSLARTQQALRFANGTSRAAGDYVALETLCAWWAWQASREAVVVELPGTEWFGEYSQEAARVMRDGCAEGYRGPGPEGRGEAMTDTKKMREISRERIDNAVLDYYRGRDGACAHYCATHLGLDRSLISKSLQRLKRRGLVVAEGSYWKVAP